MAWTVEYTAKARKALAKLDKVAAARIARFLSERAAENPRNFGKVLAGPLGEFWSYRVGDYRILAKIEDEELVILVVQIGHRSKIYNRH